MKNEFLKSNICDELTNLKNKKYTNLPTNRTKRLKTLQKLKSTELLKFKELVNDQLNSSTSIDYNELSINVNTCDVKLADMGLCLELDDLYTNELQTEYYRAPEIILEHKFKKLSSRN